MECGTDIFVTRLVMPQSETVKKESSPKVTEVVKPILKEGSKNKGQSSYPFRK